MSRQVALTSSRSPEGWALMSLLFILGVWAYLGWVIQKAHKRAAAALRTDALEIPDTVPSDWTNAFRAEIDG